MSASGSVSTVLRDDNLVMSSEDSSSPDESELELGLGLSLGGGFVTKAQQQQASSASGSGVGQYARIFTAKDLPSVVSSSSSSLSSSSSADYVAAGTKRTADSVAAANGSSQVVGWPPIRASRMNSMVNQAKSVASEEYNSMMEKSKNKNSIAENSSDVRNKNSVGAKGSTSLFVKVNMNGMPIGRKLDLNAQGCYETLAQTLEEMFHRPTNRSGGQGHNIHAGAKTPSKLLDGTSDYVLTYEDKDGDWMLVGDVPWGMFLGSVKRLRIMRRSEATGLAPSLEESNGRRRSRPPRLLYSLAPIC